MSSIYQHPTSMDPKTTVIVARYLFIKIIIDIFIWYIFSCLIRSYIMRGN